MTDEQRNEPLRDTMYSREVALRLCRHAAFYLGFQMRYVFEKSALEVIAKAQRQILSMSTGDFYRIKIMGTEVLKLQECPCSCHLDGASAPPCDTCKGLHTRQ